jgi:hypothetical protein
MKQVIQKVTQVTYVSQVNTHKFYGIIMKNDEGKAFVTQYDHSEKFVVMHGGKGLTYGLSWIGKRSLLDTISYYVDRDYEVYEFDTAKELFKWLSE